MTEEEEDRELAYWALWESIKREEDDYIVDGIEIPPTKIKEWFERND